MKKTLLILAVVATTAAAMAQGTVNFNNLNSAAGVRAPIYGVNTNAPGDSRQGNTSAGLPVGSQTYPGSALLGGGYSAQLFGGPGTGLAEGALVEASSPATLMRTGSAAGYVTAATATFNNIPKDAPSGTFQVRVWNNLGGTINTWAQAQPLWLAGSIAAGKSALFNLSGIGGDIGSPTVMVGVQSFNISFVPEPSSFALAGMGLASLLIFRRRK